MLPTNPIQMTQEEVNDYIQKILKGKIPVENPLETEAIRQLNRLSNDEAQANQRLQMIQSEVEQLKINIHKYRGQREAYAQLLIAAESDRRVKAMKAKLPPPPAGDIDPGMTPEDLKKMTGAKRIQLVKKDGEVVADTDPKTAPEAEAGSEEKAALEAEATPSDEQEERDGSSKR